MPFAAFEPPISQAGGYCFLILVGLGFALGMIAVSSLSKRYLNANYQNSEEFAVAGRSLGVGLVATGVVSSWAWPTALLWCASTGYLYGVCSAWWYSASCIILVTGFSIIANQMKKRVPHAHTALETVHLRYGPFTHLLFLFFMFLNSLIGVSCALLGASANVSAITGLPVVASIFLLPLGVVVYTAIGGLRATILTDWVHTAILFVILLFLAFKTITSPHTGGLDGLYDNLTAAALISPIDGNQDGSYMTMASYDGFLYGLLNLFANVAVLGMDNSYWQKGLAANGKASVYGYLFGGLAYHALPFLSASFGGLVALAYQNHPSFPNYPNGIPEDDINNSITMVYSGLFVAGKGGAGAVLVLTFMSMTSMASASITGVASLFSFDVFRRYIKPNASDAQVVASAHWGVAGYALVVACFSVGIQYGGVSQGWLAYMAGVIVCPGFFPLVLTIFWGKQSRLAATVSSLFGMAGGLAVWLGLAYRYHGAITIDSTQDLNACLYGTITSMFAPVPVTLVLSLIWPDNFDWARFQNIQQVTDSTTKLGANQNLSEFEEEEDLVAIEQSKDAAKLTKVAIGGFLGSVLIWWILVPWPMYGTGYIFSRGFLKFWLIAFGIVWGFLASFLLIVYPWIEGRHEVKRLIDGILGRTAIAGAPLRSPTDSSEAKVSYI